MTCKYKGKEFSEGAEQCMAGGLFQCRGNQWSYIGQCAECENGYIPVLRLVTHYINASNDEASAFKANPTKYMQEKLLIAGFDSSLIHSLHAHYSDNGKLVPPDTELELAQRSGIFEFSGDGEISYNDGSGIVALGSCNGCNGICIVIRL